MPPPMPNPTKRMTANPSRPVARYRPGKAVAEQESSDEGFETEEEEEQVIQPPKKSQPRPQPSKTQTKAQQPESEDEDDEEGFITEPEDEEDGGVQLRKSNIGVTRSDDPKAPQQASSNIQARQSFGPKDEDDDDEEDESSEAESEEEEDEESSSEEEQPKRRFQRPTFIKKSDRNHPTSTNSLPNGNTSTSNTLETSTDDNQVNVQARRLAQAELMIKDKLERDALARAMGKKAWDDDDEVAPEDMVDDTDNVDPDAEYAAWKVRELKRLKRDREAIEVEERRIEEAERRRNLTAEERDREDQEFLSKQKEDREENRNQANYLARYHHRGAFFQDDATAEVLSKRDLMGARFVDDVTDKSTLPEYMRIRDMTKLGKKGRTRYTDLKSEDTGRFGDEVKRWRGAGGNNNISNRPGDGMNTDERFLPDRDTRQGPTGANASSLGSTRRQRSRSRSRSPRRRQDERRDRRRSYSRSTSSRSSSRNSENERRRRKRSISPYGDRDKRRKVHAI